MRRTPTPRFAALAVATLATIGGLRGQQSQQQQPAPPLRDVDDATQPWRTPRSGEGIRGSVFGTPRELPARDRRSVTSWAAGAALAPHVDDYDAVPYGWLYFWEHGDEQLLRAVVTGVYNELLVANALNDRGLERVLTVSTATPPWSSGEVIDGEVNDQERVRWGWVRAGIGLGYRHAAGPEQDNMFASDVIVEPGVLYFDRADRTAPTFALPDSTFELRVRSQTRFDLLERNLLELPHAGFCCGSDIVWGLRADWDDWGLPGTEVHSGGSGRDYFEASGYLFAIDDVPTVRDDRWRAWTCVQAGAGDTLDRFSAVRVGGGPDLRGVEWETTARPLLPGAATDEFFPRRYALASLGLRRELAFFAFVDLGGTVAWLDRDREQGGVRTREDDVLTAVQARLSSGFFGDTRLIVDYAYGFDVVRSDERGGSAIVVQLSGRF
jgi:hypothetical protein